MSGDFFDSNVLIYVLSADVAKAGRAEALIGKGGAISVQVLNEVAHVARRKIGMGWAEVREVLSLFRQLLVVHPLTVQTHELGLGVAARHGFSVWDGMIVAAALEAGCSRLWSEDLQDGVVVLGRLRVGNPFWG